MLQMASVYGVQQTAKHAPAFFLPRVAEVSTAVAAFACSGKYSKITPPVESQRSVPNTVVAFQTQNAVSECGCSPPSPVCYRRSALG